jgi:serine/threonine-protein kinase
MAEVFLAMTTTASGEERLVALKRMHAPLAEDPATVEVLVTEAKLAMRFDHPNIAQTFELGCHEHMWFFLLEYVEGADLGTIAGILESRGERMSVPAALWIAHGMALGLAHAHALQDDAGQPLGIVHRDVSPQNVLVSTNGEVKLIDFGVAKVASRLKQTGAGIIKGKYAYMSPEQASAEAVDARSDIFALGICLHELLSGGPLFRSQTGGSPYAILQAVREAPVPPLAAHVPRTVAALVDGALQRQPQRRLASMAALAAELQRALGRLAPAYGPQQLADEITSILARQRGSMAPVSRSGVARLGRHEYQASQRSVIVRPPAAIAQPARSPRAERAIPAAAMPRDMPQHLANRTPAPQLLVPLQPPAVPVGQKQPSLVRQVLLGIGLALVLIVLFVLGWQFVALVLLGKHE